MGCWYGEARHGTDQPRGACCGRQVRAQAGPDGKYHFNLVATNGQVITSSERYPVQGQRAKDIESVKRNAAGAEVDSTALLHLLRASLE